MLKAGSIEETVITGYTADGLGVCRVDGCAVFVPGAIRGERCTVKITHVGQHSAHGKIEEILEKSPHRIPRACPYAKLCGGCQFWHMDYAEECELKAQRVLDALTRIGGVALDAVPILGAVGEPEPTSDSAILSETKNLKKDFSAQVPQNDTTEGLLSYRNKAQYPVQTQKGHIVAGFYREKSHVVVPMERCLIQDAVADTVKAAIQDWAEKYKVSAYDETAHTGLLRHIYVRKGFASGQVMVCIVANGNKLPREQALAALLRERIPGLRSLLLCDNRAVGNVVLSDNFRTLFGEDYIEDTLCGLTFRLSARSFYQVNHDQAERLYEKAVAAAGLTGKETVLDLYCGTGTITLVMARHAKQAIGVEIIPQAIEDAKENAVRNGVENAEFFCGDAGMAAKKLAEEALRPDVIVVDPPRKGLSPDVIEAISTMSPQRLVYVSCDPATLARDVKRLTEHGFTLQSAEAVDMFPRTAHVETVTLITRAG